MKRCVFPIIALLIAPAIALAEPRKNGNGATAAQGLFYEARALMQQAKYGEACPKLEEALRLEQGIGTQFNLADCNEHIGKTTTAWIGFLEVAAQAKAANQIEREKVARKRAAALEPRVAKLIVEVSVVPGQAPEVKRDGLGLASPAWGVPIPVDPGLHRITANAPGRQTWEATVRTTEGRTSRVTVPRDLPPAAVVVSPSMEGSAPLPVASSATTTTTSATTDSTLDFPPPMIEPRGAAQRTAGWVVSAVGAVAIGVGAGFALASINKRDESRSHCDAGDVCNATGVALRDDAIRRGNIASVALIGGSVAVAGGLVLALTAPSAPSAHEPAGKIRAAPTATSGGAGFSVQGVF